MPDIIIQLITWTSLAALAALLVWLGNRKGGGAA